MFQAGWQKKALMSAFIRSHDRKCVRNGNLWGHRVENIPSQSSELWVSRYLKAAVMVLKMHVRSTEAARAEPEEEQWEKHLWVPLRAKSNPQPHGRSRKASQKFKLQPPQTHTHRHKLSSLSRSYWPPTLPPSRCYTMTSAGPRQWYQPVFS